MKNDDFTIIGKIINTRGIKGELKIEPITSDPSRFSKLEHLYVGEKLEEKRVKNVKYDKGFVFLQFLGEEDINLVEKYKNSYLYIEDSNRIELGEDEYFISDLIGCSVYDMNEKLIGELIDVLENPANDVYIIENEYGESMVPAVKQFVKSVDIEDKKIVIDPIEGMIIEVHDTDTLS